MTSLKTIVLILYKLETDLISRVVIIFIGLFIITNGPVAALAANIPF